MAIHVEVGIAETVLITGRGTGLGCPLLLLFPYQKEEHGGKLMVWLYMAPSTQRRQSTGRESWDHWYGGYQKTSQPGEQHPQNASFIPFIPQPLMGWVLPSLAQASRQCTLGTMGNHGPVGLCFISVAFFKINVDYLKCFNFDPTIYCSFRPFVYCVCLVI